MRFPNTLAAVFLAVFLVACSGKGIDRKLETGKGADVYGASIAEASKDMTQEEAEAFNWAVSDLSLETLNQRYPNGTARSVIKGESGLVRERASKRIAELEAVKPKYDAILDQIAKLTADDTRLEMERNLHGLQPTVHAAIRNDSRLPVSQLQWRASLYLDDQETPVASSTIMDLYNNSSQGSSLFGEQGKIDAGGLPAGGAAKRAFRIGFVTGDANWTTLEIQNAKVRRVVLEPLPESVKDYGGRFYLEGAPYKELEQWKNALATAEKLSKY